MNGKEMRQKIEKTHQRKYQIAAVLTALSLVVTACSDDGPTSMENTDGSVTAAANGNAGDIVETAVVAGTFTTLTAALKATGLDTVLSDDSRKFTVFAPSDDAFAKLGDEVIGALLNDTDKLSDILLYHVLPDTVVNAATAISLDGDMVTTANGDKFALNVTDGKLFINSSEVTVTDIAASNGIIHVIDTVLTPSVDLPAEDQATPDLVDTAIAAGSFSTLVTALQTTGLDATLRTDGPFTVFAPTDEAFAKLGDATINNLLADPEALKNILLYHVVAGQAVNAVTAIGLAGTSVESANGDTLALALRDGDLFINESKVTATDVVAGNGIIHVIDTVLLPPADADETESAETETMMSDDVVETPSGTILDVARANGFDTLVAAVAAAGLDGALGHPGDTYTVFAPTEAAFAALGSETITNLLADPATLRNILLQHVIPGTVVDSIAATDLVGFDIQAGNGETLRITKTGDGLAFNGANIVATDVKAVNGVIHVIDAVLLP